MFIVWHTKKTAKINANMLWNSLTHFVIIKGFFSSFLCSHWTHLWGRSVRKTTRILLYSHEPESRISYGSNGIFILCGTAQWIEQYQKYAPVYTQKYKCSLVFKNLVRENSCIYFTTSNMTKPTQVRKVSWTNVSQMNQWEWKCVGVDTNSELIYVNRVQRKAVHGRAIKHLWFHIVER